MKFCCSSLLVLLAASAHAFVPLSTTSTLRSSSLNVVPGGFDPTGGSNSAVPLPPPSADDPVDITLANMFPTDIPMRKMQGGGTVRTWDIPPEAERLYYYIRTNGRPLKAMVELVSCLILLLCIIAC